MCRNIQQLRGAEPPATDAEIRDAALQFVRKVSGCGAPVRAPKQSLVRDMMRDTYSRTVVGTILGIARLRST